MATYSPSASWRPLTQPLPIWRVRHTDRTNKVVDRCLGRDVSRSTTVTVFASSNKPRNGYARRQLRNNLPQVKYSAKKVSGESVRDLYDLKLADGEEKDIETLQRIYALPTSILVTAFVEEASDGVDNDDKGRLVRNRNRAVPYGWLKLPIPRRKQIKTVIGYAHATTDNALVATVQDVRVAQEFRGGGVGKRLIARLMKAIIKRNVCDIGVVTPTAKSEFFRSCSFGPDQEGARVMVFNPEAVLGDDKQCPHIDPRHYVRVESLQRMLDSF